MTTVTCSLGLLPRFGKGSTFTESKLPKTPIIFWGYESSPFCKIVREKLCELEIPHVIRTCARGSPKRDELFNKTGTFQVPFIEDPNTGTNMFESADIIRYLDKQYSIVSST
jgi:glutathione S-transferase